MKLVIPTRNRPQSLASVLRFLSDYSPGTRVIVADASSDELKPSVKVVVGGFSQIEVDFRPYPYGTTYWDRVVGILEAESEEFMVMGADDDYPLMDTLAAGEAFLKANPDYIAAIGRPLIFDLHADGEMTARTRLLISIAGEDPVSRIKRYSTWPYPTSYCVCRRETLVNRYRKTQKCEMGEIFDHAAGLLDCIEGKIRALEEVGVILTRNHTETYTRVSSKLEYLEQGPVIAEIARDIASEIERKAGLDVEEALNLSTRIFGRYVGQALAGIQNQKNPQFQKSKLPYSKFLVDQCDALERLFQAGTREHEKYRERMLFVSKALRENASLSAAQAASGGNA